MAVLAVGALVASSLVYVTKHGVYGHHVTDTPHIWPRLQLVTLAILAVSYGAHSINRLEIAEQCRDLMVCIVVSTHADVCGDALYIGTC